MVDKNGEDQETREEQQHTEGQQTLLRIQTVKVLNGPDPKPLPKPTGAAKRCAMQSDFFLENRLHVAVILTIICLSCPSPLPTSQFAQRCFTIPVAVVDVLQRTRGSGPKRHRRRSSSGGSEIITVVISTIIIIIIIIIVVAADSTFPLLAR